jgi:hypothetical protein
VLLFHFSSECFMSISITQKQAKTIPFFIIMYIGKAFSRQLFLPDHLHFGTGSELLAQSLSLGVSWQNHISVNIIENNALRRCWHTINA